MNDFERKKADEPDIRPSNWAVMRCFGGPRETEMSQLLGANGPLGQALPGYVERPSQISLADAVYTGLKERRHVIAEAGTGTGKSLAALIPAIAYAREQGGALRNKRIIVSTAMIILQDQYVRKDLPFLEEHLGIPFKWTVRKGRSNYLCLERYDQTEPEDLFEVNAELREITDWLDDTETGDVNELPFDLSKLPKLKSAVTANSDNCRGSKCPYVERATPGSSCACFYYASKDRAVECEIIVVNHSLLVLNELFFGMVLPEYDALIIDEAHKLEDIVRNSLANTITPATFESILKATRQAQVLPEGRLEQLTAKAKFSLSFLEEEMARVVPKPGTYRYTPESMSQGFVEHLKALMEVLAIISLAANEAADREPDREKSQAGRLASRCGKLGNGIMDIVRSDDSDVTWVERTKRNGEKPDKLSLNTAPVHVGAWMRATLLKNPCVFLSATLATDRGDRAFDSFKERLGIDEAIELQVDSPFNYHRNALYSLGFYPGGLDKPPSDQLEWADLVFPRVELIADLTGGGVLALFTSWAVCSSVYERLCEVNNSRWSMLMQGEMSKHDLIASFRSQKNSILCATGSFFEGVDIPGEELRCVIIDKIPFPILGDPIQAAISDRLGRQSFNKHWIPHAITHLKQGVGRLIRCETDRGLLALLDPRFRSKAYAKKILQALPGYTAPALADDIRTFMRGEAS